MNVNEDRVKLMGRVLIVRFGQRPLDGESVTSSLSVKDLIRRARRGGARALVLDARDSPYADSGGLRWLLKLKEAADESGLSLRTVVASGSKVRRNLALLNAGLDLYENLQSAWRTRLSAARPNSASLH